MSHPIELFENYKKDKAVEVIKQLEDVREFIFNSEGHIFESRCFEGFKVSRTGNGTTFVNDEFATKENLEHVYDKIEEAISKAYNHGIEKYKRELIESEDYAKSQFKAYKEHVSFERYVVEKRAEDLAYKLAKKDKELKSRNFELTLFVVLTVALIVSHILRSV